MDKHIRRWEIDFLRGIAIVAMIGYHFLFDLSLLGFRQDFPTAGGWRFIVWLIGGAFLLLVGISMWLARSKSEYAFVKRGLKLLLLGGVVSLVTYIFDAETFVRFGILHLIGLSIILSQPLVKNITAAKISMVGIWGVWALLLAFTNFQVKCDQCGLPTIMQWFFMILGFWPESWQTIDYYPLLPWWGMVVMGIIIGRYLYPAAKPRFNFKNPKNKITNTLIFLGKNSLLLYLIHQPILIVVLLILKHQLM